MYFLIDPIHKVIFGWSAKAGCTHVKYLFCHYGGITLFNSESVHSVCGYHGLPKNYRQFTIVIFVRNPYKRVVSGFLNKASLMNIPSQQNTFDRLTMMLSNDRWNDLDAGGKGYQFRPYLSDKYIPEMKIDYVFDVECINYNILDQLFGQVLPQELKTFREEHGHCTPSEQKIRVNVVPMWKIPHNKLPNPTPTYDKFYNDKLKQRVRIIYQKDFEFCEKNGIYFDVNKNELTGAWKKIYDTYQNVDRFKDAPDHGDQVKRMLILFSNNHDYTNAPKLIRWEDDHLTKFHYLDSEEKIVEFITQNINQISHV